jgi:hypothetical protein
VAACEESVTGQFLRGVGFQPISIYTTSEFL